MTFDLDPVVDEVQRVLTMLAEGVPLGDRAERKHVDLKEEPGRRGHGGVIGPSAARSEAAARALAADAACMANTDDGGALVVGVADDGSLVGTELDGEWLRSRVYDLTQRLLTVDVRDVTVRGARLLVLKAPQALEPVRWNQRIFWRVDDRCVEVDASTWHARRMSRARYDWSSMESRVDVSRVRAGAVERAREFLRASGEDAALDLAEAPQAQFLRRLNIVTHEGYLTNAGVLAFVGRGEPCLDYIRRDAAGADSVVRLRESGRSLIEEVADVERSVNFHNGVRHLVRGFAAGQVRDLPPLAIREAIVNGVVHRDWASSAPTVVEYVGRAFIVTSPGGFVGGVKPENIITHPSQPRNRALAELFGALRVAEREGIGVDRMVRDMIRLGHLPPDIREVPGPYVRTALVGEALDEGWMSFLTRIDPPTLSRDLNALLLLSHLVRHRWVDVATAAPLLQLSLIETEGALRNLAQAKVDRNSVIGPVAGVPTGAAPAWHLTEEALEVLRREDAAVGASRTFPARGEVALTWARSRGRISSTELGSIVGAHPSNVGTVLRALEGSGQLRPGRQNRRGAGFFYVPSGETHPVMERRV